MRRAALGLLLQRFTYPHIATWGDATAWGAAVGLVAALLAGAVMKPQRPWREEVWACLPAFGVGFVASFVSAFACVRWLIRYVAHHDFVPFAWYRIAFGAVILVTAYSGLTRWD